LCPHPLVKEILQGRAIFAPGFQRQLGDLAELPVVVGQFALAPIMHHQQEISPVLRRGEVTGVAEIIADIKRHPGSIHPARLSLLHGKVISSRNKATS
jgi:hypothetical protein